MGKKCEFQRHSVGCPRDTASQELKCRRLHAVLNLLPPISHSPILLASWAAWGVTQTQYTTLTLFLPPVSLESNSSVAKFPVTIRFPVMPKLYDPGPGKALVPGAP